MGTCKFCGGECEPYETPTEVCVPTVCDGCWYGMRLRPEDWELEMSSKGIEVERAYTVFEGISSDPYRLKT